MKDIQDFFLPYQKKWINDNSRFKAYRKTRRAGITWCESFSSVKDSLTKKVRNKPFDTWFTSSNFDNGLEFILYCKDWAQILNSSFELGGITLLDEKNDIKAQSIKFNNGARITALSSNPKVLRGKGGKLIIDEMAFHDNQQELWRAAKPVVTWGYPMVLISSLNGKELFFDITEKIKTGKLKGWSLHETDIFKAVKDGLADKILDKKLTETERMNWIEEEKQSTGDETTWLQEYCCIAVDEASSFISYDLINSCLEDCLFNDINQIENEFYIGYDVARTTDLSVIAVMEKTGSIFYLRKIYELKNVSFKDQKKITTYLLNHPKSRKIAIDETGIGRQTAEELTDEFGKTRVNSITFNLKTKEELAFLLLRAFEERKIRIPDNEKLINDIHSIKRVPTETGVIKFDCSRAETDGHADRFWALALAIFAGTNEPYQKPVILSAKRPLYKGFSDTLNLRGLKGFLRGLNI